MGLVCDGEITAVVCTAAEALGERLEALLRRWADSECVRLVLRRRDSLDLRADRGAELLFLDMDTVELPERGRPENEQVGLIVISRDAGRAIHSYRWHPAAFLKPDFDGRRLSDALAACERNWQRGRVCLDSPYRRRSFRLPLGRVRFVEASAHYCLFNQGKQTVRMRFAVQELEGLLPKPPFVRCHRSYFVHLGEVERVSYTTLTLRDGGSLPLGRTYILSLREALRAWQGEGTREKEAGA